MWFYTSHIFTSGGQLTDICSSSLLKECHFSKPVGTDRSVAAAIDNKEDWPVSLAKLLWDGNPNFEPLDFEPNHQGVPRQFIWLILVG